MTSILQTCTPREDLLSGSFNPEIFTASLRQVIGHYQGDVKVKTTYTDAEAFFGEATSPTEGMRTVIEHVLRRLKGDNMVPFLSRLETGFGGGKTHTLIACTHLAHRGSELADVASSIGLIDPNHLSDPGAVTVVGIAGDDLPVLVSQGDQVTPYTLWAELAKQVGGDDLLKQVRAEAHAAAAPGESFFDTVLGGKCVLIMIDELAQYAARAEAATSGMGEQIGAFFMGLFNYARNREGIAIVITLASSTDAFAGHTSRLRELLTKAAGKEVSQDEAREIGDKATDDIQSVIARDAKTQTPVSSEELSAVLAKRLFASIDRNAAAATAAEYGEFYGRHASQLPPRCSSGDADSGYQAIIAKYYPFHPTLIDFLNKKLATSEDFQGTRGVLRVLAFAVQSIWDQGLDTQTIHTCHIDTSNPDLTSEILSRTAASSLRNVLSADVGAIRGHGDIDFAKSNAELADEQNPHPGGLPLHRWTWRTVFLHSLVGRQQGIGSNIFGLVQEEARLEVTQPGLPPSQVDTALAELSKRAFYLRHQENKYFASLDPSVNKALAQIREGLTDLELRKAIEEAARKVVTAPVPTFTVHHDVSAPDHLPDNQSKPMLGVVSPFAGDINASDFVLFEREGHPRKQQNLVFLLVPDTVQATAKGSDHESLYGNDQVQRNLHDLQAIARDVVAMRRLQQSPENYAIQPQHLNDSTEDGFANRHAEREQALLTRMTQAYGSIWYPSATGQTIRKEIQASGGEGGASVIEQIRQTLIEDQELITEQDISGSLIGQLSPMFFDGEPICKINDIRKRFAERRSWPILHEPQLLNNIIKDGVRRGTWCVYRLGDASNTIPDEFYAREGDADGIPIDVNLDEDGFSLVTPEGAAQRGWNAHTQVPYDTIRGWVKGAIDRLDTPAPIASLVDTVSQLHGEVTEKNVLDVVTDLTRAGESACRPEGDAKAKHGTSAIMYVAEGDDEILPPARAIEAGWIEQPTTSITVNGRDATDTIFPLLKTMASLYARGGKSTINRLRIERLPLKDGGQISITFSDLTPAAMSKMGGLLDGLAMLGEPNDDTQVDLSILDPIDDCKFVDKLGVTVS